MEFVTVESRPRIQACNIFLHLTEPTDPQLTQVSLLRNSINIQTANNSFVITLPTINMVASSMSNLNVSDKWIVFRVQTAPPNSSNGTFSTEVVNNLDAIENDCADSPEVIILPPKDAPLSLLCYSCDSRISKRDVSFSKIMQLPSTDCEPADWFCCSSNGLDYDSILRPRTGDFFYDANFSILNRNAFSPDIIISQTDVLCKCAAVLGTVNDEYSLKIWNYAIQYQLKSVPGVNIGSTTPLEDFKLALRKCAGKDAVRDILFVAIEGNVHSYLVVKTLEKKLNLIVESDPSPGGNIDVTEKTVLKVLYHCPNTTAPDLKTFTNAHVCRLGFCCLMTGLEYLTETTRRIPPSYSQINGVSVGYIM